MNASDVKIGMRVKCFDDEGTVSDTHGEIPNAFWVEWDSGRGTLWAYAEDIEPSKIQPINDDISEQLRVIHKALLAMAKSLNVTL